MVNQETIKKQNLKEFGFKSKDGAATKVLCKVCKEYYSGNPQALNKLQGHIKKIVKNWVNGTSMIKKNNAVDYLKIQFTQCCCCIFKRLCEYLI